MTPKHDFIEHYKQGNTPWDIGQPDGNLEHAVSTVPIAPCKALDIGCGTGDNAVWLAERGFSAVGVDLSEIAVDKAREKAARKNVRCTFTTLDFLKSPVEGAPFGFVFDRGCFHTMESDAEREAFVKQVRHHLGGNGLWLSLIGNADEQRPGQGPPRRTARDIANAVEPYFEILRLDSGQFGWDRPGAPRAWICLMRKR